MKSIIYLSLFLSLMACQTKTAEEYEKLYKDAYNAQHYQDALKYINKAIEQDSLNYEYYLLRSDIYKQKEDYHLAIKDLNKVIDAGKGGETTYYNRAVYYLNEKEHDKAIADFEKLYSETKNNNYLFYIGQAYFQRNNYKLALIYFNDVLSTNPKLASAYNYRAFCYWQLDKKDLACAEWQKAIVLGLEEAKNNLTTYCTSQSDSLK